MNKLIAATTVITLLVAIQVSVMIYGWGLTPQNWGWIIGVGLFGNVFMTAVGNKVMKNDD